MDSFDRRNIETLMGQKPQTFHQILTTMGFTHNTLQQHLDQLLEWGLVERHKQPQEGPGRPVYVYSVPKNLIGRPMSAILTRGQGWWFFPSMGCNAYGGMRRVVTVKRSGVAAVPGIALKL